MMRQYFDLVLDLLEIENKSDYEELAQILENTALDTQVLFAHRLGFLFARYLELIRNQIQPEEFVLVGDVDSSLPLWKQGEVSAQELIMQCNEDIFPLQEMIVVDKKVWNVMLTAQQQETLSQKLQKEGKILIVK